MLEEGFCFPSYEVVFLRVVGVDGRVFCLGEVAMEVSESSSFIFGGRVVMFNSVGVFALANAEIEH